MNNGASINYTANFIFLCERTLENAAKAETELEKRGILDRQTVQGIKWAIEFVNSLNVVRMSEKQLHHAIRLTYFRGRVCPEYRE